MTRNEGTGIVRIAGYVIALFGLWHAAAPWTMGYGDSNTAVASDVAAGITLAVLGTVLAGGNGLGWAGRVAACVGLWALVAPAVLGFSDRPAAALEALWVGPLTIGLAAVAILAVRTDHPFLEAPVGGPR
jgi:hypothetical protein